MRTAWLVAALSMAPGPVASGQRLYWGAIGGTGLTPDFPGYDVSGPADAYGNRVYHFQHLPGSRSLILGGLAPGGQYDYPRTNANIVELIFGIGF